MNYSNFPQSIDTFVKKYPLQASDVQKSIEYKQLKEKLNRTPQEDDRLAQLSNELSYAFIDPEEWNKFQDALVNTQEFFLQEVYVYIQQKQNEFQAELDKFAHIGEYNPTVQYRKRNTVTFQGETYLCLQDSLGNAPNPTNNTQFWAKVAARGATGLQGVAGTGLRPRGAYNPSIQYNIDDAVQFGGQLYGCLQPNIGQSPNPNQDTIYWALALSKGQSTGTVGFKNYITITDTRTNVNIGIPEYNKNTDILEVIQNTTTLTEGVHYSINPNGASIDNLQGLWDGTVEPVLIEFKIIKNYLLSPTYGDGSMLMDESVGKEKLKGALQQEIDDKATQTDVDSKIGLLSELQTTNKENLVSAVNENTQTVATHLANYEQQLGTANLLTTDKTLKGALNELFTNANNGKLDWATVVGSPLLATDTFAQLKDKTQTLKNTLATNLTNKQQASIGTEPLQDLINKVANINTGRKWASGTVTSTTVSDKRYFKVTGVDFLPSVFLMYNQTQQTLLSNVNFFAHIPEMFTGASLYEGTTRHNMTKVSYEIANIEFYNFNSLSALTLEWLAIE